MIGVEKNHSLERELKTSLIIQFVLVLGLFCTVLLLSNASSLVFITIITFVILIYIPWLMRSYKTMINPLINLSNSTEALRQEDYSIVAGAHYKTGIVSQLYKDAALLNSDLQQRKDRYNQDVYLIYRLIEKLGTPVLVFNSKHQLNHANAAFAQWHGQPWQNVRGLSATRLGLVYSPQKEWSFIEKTSHKGWQIKASIFLDGKDDYQLLMLNNIESEVRETQQEAWQQIIRILSHEIRNSLTPIQSLAQSLLSMDEISPRPKEALQVIYDRSFSLQEFVTRYATMTQSFKINTSHFSSKTFINKIVGLFSSEQFDLEIQDLELFADQVLLEQVMINLVQNGLDSSKLKHAETKNNSDKILPILITLTKVKNMIFINIKDSGLGLSNPENLFVPFYTTKVDGQGIGLFFCRNIVEKHGGKLFLEARKEQGAKAIIQLPYK
ncbi:MAG: nitrogen fixation/metabolism regulation signal transduction histidine kinase [Paraglaciecola sp.]|jgi:two-component system nitrogen regulation sensor histidine kinase NtrY